MRKRLLLIFVRLLILIGGAGWPAAAQSLTGPGNSLFFQGGTNYINAGTNNRGITNLVTAEAWVKTTSNNYMWLAGKYLNSLSEEKGFFLYVIGGKASFDGRVGAGQYMTSGYSSTVVNDGNWHHLAGVYSANTWKIYVDGVLENSGFYAANSPNLTTSTVFTIGNYFYNADQYFNGEIEEVRVWRTARTETEIRDNMCRKFSVAPADLVAYYRFDQLSGTIAQDQGSVPFNGTLTNFPNGANPWRVSGAPIGDASAYAYQASPSSTLRARLATAAGDSAVVATLAATTRGVQVYAVNSTPVISPGSGAATTYVGVFTTGPGSRYSVRLRPAAGLSCKQLTERVSNELPWQIATTTNTVTSFVHANASSRGEYISLLGGATPRVAISGDSLLCASGQTVLTAAAANAAGYLWNTGATTPILAVTQPGVYTVTASFASGCSSSARRNVKVLLPAAVLITGDSLLCPGRTATLTASAIGATAVRWNTGAATPTLAVTAPGIYTATLTYGPGCTATARRQVRALTASPAFKLGADTTLCEGEFALLRGPAGQDLRYQWSDGSTNQQLQVRDAGRYTLRVFTACDEHSASRNIAVQSCLVIPNVITANADGRNDLFTITGLAGLGWQLDVYTRWGKPVLHTDNYTNDWGGSVAPGLYYVLLQRPATGYRYKGWIEVILY